MVENSDGELDMSELMGEGQQNLERKSKVLVRDSDQLYMFKKIKETGYTAFSFGKPFNELSSYYTLGFIAEEPVIKWFNRLRKKTPYKIAFIDMSPDESEKSGGEWLFSIYGEHKLQEFEDFARNISEERGVSIEVRLVSQEPKVMSTDVYVPF